MLIARPAAVLICLAPFRFSFREKLFISWVGLRGAVSVFLASIPMLVGLPGAHFYFDVAFVVVMLSLLIQGWTIGAAGRFLRIGQPRPDVNAHRTELDLPGTLKQELVGYPVVADSPYLRRGIAPTWAKLTLVVRDERVLTPEEAAPVREGDQVYFLAPPDRVQALDRFFAERTSARPDAALVEDFFVPGDVTMGALGEIYGLTVAPEDAADDAVGLLRRLFHQASAAAERRDPARARQAGRPHRHRGSRRAGRPAARRARAGAAHLARPALDQDAPPGPPAAGAAAPGPVIVRFADHSAMMASMASSPSVSAAGPGCRISGDLISRRKPSRTAGMASKPGRPANLAGTNFLPHHEPITMSGARRDDLRRA